MEKLLQKMTAALVLLAYLSVCQSQSLYKSTDPSGRTVYSDKPPAAGTPSKTIAVSELPNTALPSGTLEELKALRAKTSSRGEAPTLGVVLFAASWCGYCRQARAHLAASGVQFTEQDIDTPSGKLAFVQAGGTGGVPLLLFNGQRVVGYSKDTYALLVSQRR